MTKCEKLQEVLDEAIADGNGPLIEVLETAMVLAGCGVATADSGGSGHGDPDGPH